jgi:hypothetical protein
MPHQRERFDMERATDRVGPPSRLLLALEVRGILELQAFLRRAATVIRCSCCLVLPRATFRHGRCEPI